MRILLITDNHTPTGGAENYFFDLKKRLQNIPGLKVSSLGFAATEAVGDDFIIFKKLQSNFSKLIWQILFHPGMYFKLRKHIKKFQPDVIHLHNIKHYTASLLHAVKPYPLVQTIHDYGAVCPSAHNIHKDFQACPTGMRKACFWQHQVKHNVFVYLGLAFAFLKTNSRLKKTVKKFFAPSPLLVDYLKKNEFKDASYIAPFKKESRINSFDAINPYHFLFAGNLGRHKGIYVLVQEFALARQKESRLSLTIAGMGSEEKRLQALVSELELKDCVRFCGWQENLDQEYQKSAAVIFPSLWIEAFGLIITEAMNHGRPVIGSNRGSPPWLIDDKETGLIFDPLKKGDLAEKILMLAGNMDLIINLGKKAAVKLETFIDNEKVLKQIIAAYKEAMI
jgi:glycosyltransferase involved in cell wall biosynthesis